MAASASGTAPAPLELILPVITRANEGWEQPDSRAVQIAKEKGMLTVSTDAVAGFETVPRDRTFNLVPGFECIPLKVVLETGKETRVRLEGAVKSVGGVA